MNAAVVTIATLSAEASALIRLLVAMPVGAVLTYEQMSAAIGVDVRKRRGALSTARHRALEDEGAHTETVRGVGVKRISSAEVGASQLPRDLRRSRSAARKGLRRVSKIVINDVPQEERAALFGRASMLQIIDHAASTKGQAKAIAAVASSDLDVDVLPLRKALAALRG